MESCAFTTWLQLLFIVTITLQGFLSWHICCVTDPQETHDSEQGVGCVLLSGNEEALKKLEVANLLFLKQVDLPVL